MPNSTVLPDVLTSKMPWLEVFCTWKAVLESVEFLNRVAPVLPTVMTFAALLLRKFRMSDEPLEAACNTPATEPEVAAWT